MILGYVLIGNMYVSALTSSNDNSIPDNIISGIYTGSFTIPEISMDTWNTIQVTDIGDNWSKDFITRLIVRGIVNNVVLYNPDRELTRAEFLKIIIQTTGWVIPTTNLNMPFDDVQEDDWFNKYISLALSKGIITQNNMSFRPHYTITRAEATKMLIITLGVGLQEPTSLRFTDTDMTSDLTKYIEAANSLSIISGQMVEGKRYFRPNDSMTRSEIAKVVVKAFDL